MGTHEDESLLKPGDLAALLKVPVATIYQWRYAGTGPPGIRVGRHLRFRRSDVNRWLDKRLKAAR